MMKYICLILLCLFLDSCSEEVPYFNGEIVRIDKFEKEVDLIGEKLNLDGLYTGYLSAYDSLLLFASYKYADYFLYVFDLKSSNQVASLCQKGEGPIDFAGFTHAEQYRYDKNGLKLWVGDDLKQYCSLDITSSLMKGETCIDSLISFRWKEKWQHPLSVAFIIDENRILAKSQCQKLYYKDDKYLVTKYYLYENGIHNEIKDYTIFNKPIITKNEQTTIPFELFLSSIDRIKPDRTKIAMGMAMLGQINILDIESGMIKGLRMNDSEDFDYLIKDPCKYKMYYTDLSVDDRYIYALYANVLIDEYRNFPFCTNTIHIFDWNGNPVCQLFLDKKLKQIAVDPLNDILFGDNNEEEIYQYDLSFLRNN